MCYCIGSFLASTNFKRLVIKMYLASFLQLRELNICYAFCMVMSI